MIQKRRIHWNREFNYLGENITRWYFLIVNEPREIKQIRTKIYEALKPVDNIENIDACLIRGTDGFHYELFRLESPKSKFENPRAVYGGTWKKDRGLYTRKDDSSLLNIIEREELG